MNFEVNYLDVTLIVEIKRNDYQRGNERNIRQVRKINAVADTNFNEDITTGVTGNTNTPYYVGKEEEDEPSIHTYSERMGLGDLYVYGCRKSRTRVQSMGRLNSNVIEIENRHVDVTN